MSSWLVSQKNKDPLIVMPKVNTSHSVAILAVIPQELSNCHIAESAVDEVRSRLSFAAEGQRAP